MKLILLSRNRFLYSSRRLIKAARSGGHDLAIVNPLAVTLGMVSDRPRITHRGEPLVGDIVIPRIGQAITDYGIAVVRQFEMLGVPVVNNRDAISLSRDKIRTLQCLLAAGVPIPPSVIIHSGGIEDAIELVGGLPVIAKTTQGTQGVGVMLLESAAAVRSVLETMWSMGQNVIIQRFIAESSGRDIRVIVMGGKAVTSMRRISQEGEFRSNIHRGAVGEPIELPDTYRRAALDAVRAVGLDIAGVDLLETNRGPMVLEINSTPGLEGIETATGENVAQRFIDFAEEMVAQRRGLLETGSGVVVGSG